MISFQHDYKLHCFSIDSKSWNCQKDFQNDDLMTLHRFDWILEVLNCLNISCRDIDDSKNKTNYERKSNFFFDQRVVRSFISLKDSVMLKNWAKKLNLILNSLIFNNEARMKLLFLLYFYRHFNSTRLKDLSCTNLIIHRVQIKSKTKLYVCKFQNR